MEDSDLFGTTGSDWRIEKLCVQGWTQLCSLLELCLIRRGDDVE